MERGTSVYLVDRVIPMLPHELSNGICSLNPNEDRLAVSCVMEFDENGKQISYEIFPSVIRSRIQMTYKKVNMILEKDTVPEGYEEYVEDLKLMHHLANILRKMKEKRGYIDFEQFKKMLYELYYKERVPVPNYPVMKYVYDYVDVRKDGVIDLNEWNKVFAITESNLDVIKGPGSQYIRDWEGSEQITEIYKLISKNKKAIKDKVKLYTIRTSDNLFIQENHLIDILINVLGKIRISYPQWKMIVALGDTQRNGVIDFNAFIKAIDSYANIKNSHPTYSIKK